MSTTGLSELPPWKAEEARRFFYVHVNSRLDQLQRTWEEAAAGLPPASPLLVVGQPTVFDPTRAPADRRTLLERAVLSPDDMEAVNPDLVGGDLIAGSHHLAQWYDRRPFPATRTTRCPWKGSTWSAPRRGREPGLVRRPACSWRSGCWREHRYERERNET